MPSNIKQIAIAAAVVGLFIGGWTARGWYEDSKDLAAVEAIEKSRELMRELANDISKNTEQAIGGIRVENRNIYNETIREITLEKIYADCVLPESGRLRANQARSGASAGKPDQPLPQARTSP